MLQPTDKILENMMFLRDVVIPWMRANPDKVNYDTWADWSYHGCVACFGGWYMIKRLGSNHSLAARNYAHSELWKHFAETREEYCRKVEEPLFAGSQGGTLEDRARRLDLLIAERERRLLIEPDRTLPPPPVEAYVVWYEETVTIEAPVFTRIPSRAELI